MKVNPPVTLEPGADGRCDAGPLTDLFARYQDELLGTLYYLVGNLEDARDALQETFIKCWAHQRRLAEVDNPKAWIFRVALNTGRDARGAAWRRKRQPLEGDATMLLANYTPPDARLEQEDELTRVRQAVAELRPEEQDVFLLRQNGQLPYDEIARALAIPLGTVKTRMRKALANLRAVLAPASPH
jgi:RNA polymerase sigma factor (sigma-70 family)